MAKLQKAERPIAVTGWEKAILQLRTFCVGLHDKYPSHLPSHVSRSFVVLYVSFRFCEGSERESVCLPIEEANR